MTLTALDFAQPADVEVLDGGAVAAAVVVPQVPKLPPTPTPYPTPPVETIIPCGDNVPCISPTPVTTQIRNLVDAGATTLVSETGQLAFSFQPGDGPGLHRVSVLVGGNQYILRFWQQDLARPNNNSYMVKAY